MPTAKAGAGLSVALTKYETTNLDTSTLPKFDISRSNFMSNAPMGARQRESVFL